MADTMKALVKSKAEVGLWLEDVPIPAIGKDDVLIKIRKTSICGTDVHIWNWDEWAQKTIPVGMTVGHEFVGVIEAIGDNVRDFKPGELVSGEGHLVCGHCRNCMAGRRHLCPHTSGVGVNRAGAYAEYLSIPQTNVWAANPSIPEEVISCFDPFGNAAHTALSFPVLGEDVLITGAGPIGCMAAAIAKFCGARHVVVTDLNPHRLELASKLGATRVVNVAEESIEDVCESLGMKEGFDVGMEMSGAPSAFRSMIDVMAHGGKIALLGILPETAVPWDTIAFNMITIKGIYGREMYETWYKMEMMLQSGLDISSIITHRFHYTDFEQGFEAMRSGNSGKVVLDWTE
jgi:threonine 3-dehydrogenase